jgi:hypothetical protein
MDFKWLYQKNRFQEACTVNRLTKLLLLSLISYLVRLKLLWTDHLSEFLVKSGFICHENTKIIYKRISCPGASYNILIFICT